MSRSLICTDGAKWLFKNNELVFSGEKLEVKGQIWGASRCARHATTTAIQLRATPLPRGVMSTFGEKPLKQSPKPNNRHFIETERNKFEFP